MQSEKILKWQNVFDMGTAKEDDTEGKKDSIFLCMYTVEGGEIKIGSSSYTPEQKNRMIELMEVCGISTNIDSEKPPSSRFIRVKTSEKHPDMKMFVYCKKQESEKQEIDAVMKLAGSAVCAAKANSFKYIVYDNGFPMPRGFVEGLFLASYEYTCIKKEKSEMMNIRIFSPEGSCSSSEEEKICAGAENFARFLADTPANYMFPENFATYAQEYIPVKFNTVITVHTEEELAKKGFGLHLSVAQGSKNPPCLVEIQYKGKEDQKEEFDLTLVGKGITFDSGGVSIKPSQSMEEMKGDMGGAAAILAAIGAVSRMNVAINIRAIIALSENMVDGNATKPGDVHTCLNGDTVEVINTDAEGRLVLADALVYAQKEKTKYVVDVATLTGAISVALGNLYIGMYTNNQELGALLLKSGEATGEYVWNMPYNTKYKEGMKSGVADIKNISGGRYGGSCTAAAFLGHFVEKNTKWAHLDIAGVMNKSYLSKVYGEGMTGSPTRMLIDFCKSLQKE